MYETVDDANMRLAESIIRYEGRPIMVHNIGMDEMLSFDYLDGSGSQRVGMYNRGFDLTPVPLGYVNIDPIASYVERVPIRRWKQGLHYENVSTLEVGKPDGRIGQSVINTPAMADTILGIYPNLPECFALVSTGKVVARAFSSTFAIARLEDIAPISIYYKGKKVGWLEKGDPTLSDEFSYLTEALEEVWNA